MRRNVRSVWSVCLGLTAAATLAAFLLAAGNRQTGLLSNVQADEQSSGGGAGGLPPLVIDRDAPLLLDELPDAMPPGEPDEILADNSACHVCHTNYEREELAVVHAREDVGCMDCHGKSIAHRNDEDNITPPDKMYALDQIDSACGECHETHDAPAREVIARWQERCPAKSSPEDLVCTDCHGTHRLAFRTVRWDKKTRELIVEKDDGRAE